MKKILRKGSAILLVLAMLISVCAPCAFAAPAPSEKEFGTYKKYVLLGDSIASGHRDDKSVKSEFKKVKDSYAAYVADALGAKLYPLACPGFRTTELRYMVEGNGKTDEYMFHNMHSLTPEEFEVERYEMRKKIAEADLVTIGIGGNDFYTCLKWVVQDESAKDGVLAKFIKDRNQAEAEGEIDDSLEGFIEFANKTKALPVIAAKLPIVFTRGVQAIKDNWGPIVEAIYDLNPDVTLMAISMGDIAVKNEADSARKEETAFKYSFYTTVFEIINKVMREGAEKYGYTYVDTDGTIFDVTHPTTAGHRIIADKILDLLPNMSFPYSDVSASNSSYKAIEKVYERGIISGSTKTTFNPDGVLTKAVLAQALYTIADKPAVNTETTFADVNSKSKSYKAVAWAHDNGILKADRNGNFNPNGEVTYNDLYWAVNRAGKVTNKFNGKLTKFNNKWGTNSLFRPITRAQAATKLVNLF